MTHETTMTETSTTPAAYILPAELRAGLLQYLMSRPYAEVAHGVQALDALQPCLTPCACHTTDA